MDDEEVERLDPEAFLIGKAARIADWRAKKEEAKYRKLFHALEQKRYRETHREQIRERGRAWRKANPEKAREAERAYRAAHRDKIRASRRAWKAANRDRVRAALRRWKEAHPALVRESQRRGRERRLQSMREQQDPTVHCCQECGVAWCLVRTPTLARGRVRFCSAPCRSRARERRRVRHACEYCGWTSTHKPTCSRPRKVAAASANPVS